uniref:Uncharacterized protein n=1 Tax=Rhizophora mucronata TaxID=61149 RepID=A0A2P2QPW2_RHIMU
MTIKVLHFFFCPPWFFLMLHKEPPLPAPNLTCMCINFAFA